MCGIAGIVSLNGLPVDEKLIDRINSLLHHRGPDGSGNFFHKATALTHTRLAILDLTPNADQPMSNDNGSLVLVYNGEVYNYVEIREELESFGCRFRSSGDTEVVLKAYEHWGPDCLRRFNGMFAFAIYDVANEKLFLARDRFGVKPLYYYQSPERFAFSSEIKPLLLSMPSIESDDQIVFDYLFHNIVDHTDRTFFKGIYRLPAGSWLEFKNGRHAITKWWNLEPAIEKENLRELFVEAVRLRLRSDVPVGSCLSGGIDSSSIVCSMAQLLGEKREDIHTFSAIYPGHPIDESRYIDDVVQISKVKSFRTTPTENTLISDLERFVEVQEEPFSSSSQYSQYKVMELAGQTGLKVLLDGQGADEALGGYLYCLSHNLASHLKHLRIANFIKDATALHRTHQQGMQHVFWAIYELFPRLVKDQTRKSLVAPWINPEFMRHFKRASDVYEIKSYSDAQESLAKQMSYGLSSLLRYEDKSSMAFSIETRTPFLDYRLVKTLFAIPFEEKTKEGVTKVPFREAMKGILPESIRMRKDKIGFATPQELWMNSAPMREYMKKTFISKTFKNRPYWIAAKVEQKLNRESSIRLEPSDNIWRILNLELWLRRFID